MLTAEERAWALKELREYQSANEFEYVDRERIAEKGDPAEEGVYNEIKARGCCGSFDFEVFYRPTRKWILIGCNYGH